MKRRAISAILVIVLTLSLSISAFATTYSDLPNSHWAKVYMEDLAAKGLLSGYSDGTMKPDNKISTSETLVFLSRLYTLTDAESQMIQADYEAYVKEIVSPTLSWAYKNIEVCLAAGIITKDELKTMSLTGDTTKERISVFLVRAIQLTSEATKLASTKLTFADATEVTSDCVGSIAELYSLGIVKGNEKNKYEPKSAVTRGVAAALISRALEYNKTNNRTLTIAAYNGATREEGTITAISGSNMEVCSYNGITRTYGVSSGTNITVNKISKALDLTYIGCHVLVTVKNGVVISVAIDYDSTVKWLLGTVTSASGVSSSNSLSLKELKTGTNIIFVIPSNAIITRNRFEVLFSTIQTGDFITLKTVNGVVSELRAAPNSTMLTGTISSITYGSTITFKMIDSSEFTYSFQFDIANLPTVKRGDKAITFDRLQVGNKITLLFEKGKVTLITADGTANTVTGVLTSLTMTTSSTTWVITTATGVQTTYILDNGAGVYNGTTSILLSDIHPGDSVSVVVYNNTITEINLVSSSTSSTRVSGTVMKVDAANSAITILTASEKLVTIKTSSVVSIIVASTGNYTNLSAIATNSKLTAYGTYSDSKTFAAKSIIIE